jgi:hypothetical protein
MNLLSEPQQLGMDPGIIQALGKNAEDSDLYEGAACRSAQPHEVKSVPSYLNSAKKTDNEGQPGAAHHFYAQYKPVGNLRHALKTLSKTRFRKQDWSKGRSKEERYSVPYHSESTFFMKHIAYFT